VNTRLFCTRAGFIVSDDRTALGFQILHILYSAEKFLERLKNQSPNFEVIFFECSFYFSTYAVGSTPEHPRPANTSTSNPLPLRNVTSFDFSSRFLASKIVIQHLNTITIPVRHFSSPEDNAYHEYTKTNRVSLFVASYSRGRSGRSLQPYFIMMNDGGMQSSPNHNLGTQATFLQRALVYFHLSRGIAVVTMSSCDYQDAKVRSV